MSDINYLNFQIVRKKKFLPFSDGQEFRVLIILNPQQCYGFSR